MTNVPFDPEADDIRANMTPFQRYEYDWAERYEPLIRQLVGPHLLEKASVHADRQECADFIVRYRHVLNRMRRPPYSDLFPNDFTIRNQSFYGKKTEMDRILEGHGDWMFYGHAAAGEVLAIARWWIIELENFRFHWRYNRDIKWEECGNVDGGSRFIAFDITSFPVHHRPIIVAQG